MQTCFSMLEDFRKNLFTNILSPSFPCVMAKAVANKGFFHTISVPDLMLASVDSALTQLQEFVTLMQEKKARLSSCALKIENPEYKNFKKFEEDFWPFLKEINAHDKKEFAPDPTVDSDPRSNNFSYSIKSESFFIIALHPESPRWSRRFKHPTIVFNPHKQFEEMRSNGTYMKVRDMIRAKDKLLQGNINPMLQNFGEKSEVFQYLGKVYNEQDPVPLTF